MGALFHFDKTLPGLTANEPETQLEVFTHGHKIYLRTQNPADSAEYLAAELTPHDAQELLDGIRKALTYLDHPFQ